MPLDTKPKVNAALHRQRRIRQRIKAAKYIPELGGGTVMRIDAALFHHAAQLHPDKNGRPDYSVCNDDGFWRDMTKRVPELAIPMERSSRCVVSVPDLSHIFKRAPVDASRN